MKRVKGNEKPVRINGNEKMRNFNEKVRNGLEHALNFMLGTEGNVKIQISAFEPFLMPIEAYINSYKKKSVLIKIHVERAYKGELYWFFEMPTALALGGMLRMMPPASIQEKVAGGVLDANDLDAFGEVGNQLNGILDRAFRTLTNKDVHLRMDFAKKVYPNESIQLDTFINEEEYIVFLSTITLPAYGTQKLTLLLPRSLYEVLLNIEVELEGIPPKRVLVYSGNPENVATLQSNMNSRYTKVLPVSAPEEILTLVEQQGFSAIGIELSGLTFPLDHKNQILLKRFLANRNFMLVPYFLTWANATEEQVKELQKMGLGGATAQSFTEQFPAWAKTFTADPS